jgi:putative FmdB family regulatory protein
MPTYEYACKSCGSHLEVVQSFTDDPLTECPGCEGPLRKVFGSIGITFKGGGFYKTDSRSSSSATSPPSSDSGSGSSTDSGSSSSGSGDTSSSTAASA